VKSGPHCCGNLKLCALDDQVIGTVIDFKVSLRNQKRRVSLEFRFSEVQLWLTKFSRWETIQNYINEAFKLSQGSRLVLSVIDWDQAEIMMYVRYTRFLFSPDCDRNSLQRIATQLVNLYISYLSRCIIPRVR
jgi:hypothetical protein